MRLPLRARAARLLVAFGLALSTVLPAASTAVKSPRMLTGVPSSSIHTSSDVKCPVPPVDGVYGTSVAAAR